MTQLVKIGNSQGIRIPKPLVEQAHLEGKELKLQLVKDGLLITPQNGVRSGWKEAIELSLAANDAESLNNDWLDLPLDSDDELEW
ncbi:MAG: AbrB/MazE/SpoVT family DNA-binding domain-containing protein [Gammaproteobacteria bacterium]|nr:AbrB/MazE/SpoVT family DNA-binding domain-containing protein [Gammaproteobacteria bacterium]MCF6261055.1 AbrB/MazE/SpoVT family DNA-binding domain-containing protein [Gammaproteobacteria bacterium]